MSALLPFIKSHRAMAAALQERYMLRIGEVEGREGATPSVPELCSIRIVLELSEAHRMAADALEEQAKAACGPPTRDA
jgi:hypothetical protein